MRLNTRLSKKNINFSKIKISNIIIDIYSLLAIIYGDKMIVFIYCDILYQDNIENNKGSVVRFLEKLRNERPDLWTQVSVTLNKVMESSNLGIFERQGRVEKLKRTSVPIYEFKIPPTRKGGVVRLYFAFKKNDLNTIHILSAELKHKKEPDPIKIKQAEQRYKEVCL